MDYIGVDLDMNDWNMNSMNTLVGRLFEWENFTEMTLPKSIKKFRGFQQISFVSAAILLIAASVVLIVIRIKKNKQ